MTDEFREALQQRLDANADLARRRRDAEAEMDRALQAQAEQDAAEVEAIRAHHARLSAHLQRVADQLKASRPESFIVRTGWTQSGEEFIAKMTTRQMSPKRSLFVEVDRDDDEVLARWTSDIGNAVEIWTLREVSETMLTELVLQVADDAAWTGRRPPAFP